MKKVNNKKGFTLAELLIVVAIIGVLVAVAIPVFAGHQARAKRMTTLANLRSAYAEAAVEAASSDMGATKTVSKTGIKTPGGDTLTTEDKASLPFALGDATVSDGTTSLNFTFTPNTTTGQTTVTVANPGE